MALTQSMIDITAKVLQEWGMEATFEMRRLLNTRLKRPSPVSALAESIDFTGTKVTVDGSTAVWNLNDYWIYVDLGVKGVINKDAKGNETRTYKSKEYPSGFRFRNYGTPQGMVNAMQNYVARKGIRVREHRSEKTEVVIARSFEVAERMAYFVKRKGITGTLFYSDVFSQKGFDRLTNKLEKALGQQIEITILQDLK